MKDSHVDGPAPDPPHIPCSRPRLTTASSNSTNNPSNSNNSHHGAMLDPGCGSDHLGAHMAPSLSARSANDASNVVVVGKKRSSDTTSRIMAGKRQSIRGALKRVSFFEEAGANNDGMEEEETDRVKGTFIDVEMMKDKVRKSLLQPKVTIQDYYKDKGCAQALARATWFENLTLLIIAFNALWIAHDTDANDAEVLLDADIEFQVAENAFCLFFSLELTIRFSAFKYKTNCFRDAWFVFDSALVTMMVLETWVMSAILLIVGSSSGSGAGDASIIRIARLLRLSRMARMARLLRVVPELMILIKGMVAAIRSVTFTIILLVAIMYVFSICLTQLAAGTDLQRTHFQDVPTTMYRLLMHGCLLDAPKEMSDRLAQESWLLPPIFWLFVLMAALTVMNMLVGVLCEVVSGVAAVEKEENLVNFVKGRVRKIVEEIDEDGNMSISKAEFRQILENRQACRALQDVGVDVIGLVDFADTIFEDEQGNAKRELSFVDFMDLILQLRGTNVATVKDVVQIRKMLRHCTGQVNELRRELLISTSGGPPTSPSSKTPPSPSGRRRHQDPKLALENPLESDSSKPKLENSPSESDQKAGSAKDNADADAHEEDSKKDAAEKKPMNMLSDPHWEQLPNTNFASVGSDESLRFSSSIPPPSSEVSHPRAFATEQRPQYPQPILDLLRVHETLASISKFGGLLQTQIADLKRELERSGAENEATVAASEPDVQTAAFPTALAAPSPPPFFPAPPDMPPTAVSFPPEAAKMEAFSVTVAPPTPGVTLPPLTMGKRNPIRLKALAGTATSTATPGNLGSSIPAIVVDGSPTSLAGSHGFVARAVFTPSEMGDAKAGLESEPAAPHAAGQAPETGGRRENRLATGPPPKTIGAATVAVAEAIKWPNPRRDTADEVKTSTERGGRSPSAADTKPTTALTTTTATPAPTPTESSTTTSATTAATSTAAPTATAGSVEAAVGGTANSNLSLVARSLP